MNIAQQILRKFQQIIFWTASQMLFISRIQNLKKCRNSCLVRNSCRSIQKSKQILLLWCDLWQLYRGLSISSYSCYNVGLKKDLDKNGLFWGWIKLFLLALAYREAIAQRCSVKKMFLEISENSRDFFLVKLHALA